MTLNEEWRPVVGYEGVYEVSNLGRVKRVGPAKGAQSGRVLKPLPDRRGYQSVVLWCKFVEKRTFIHKLVAAAFIGPRPDGLAVNHIDHDPTNNRAANLEYVTNRDNTHHAMKAGRMAHGERHGSAKLTADQIIDIRAASGITQRELAAKYGVGQMTINAILRRKTWTHV